jgi:hypothetical protein
VPHPLYFVENDHGRLGREFMALDRDDNSRADIVRQIRSGGIHPVKIIEVIEPCEDFPRGQVTNVTDELIAEAEQPREPRSHAELRQMLIDMQNDHRRDLIKEGMFGW